MRILLPLTKLSSFILLTSLLAFPYSSNAQEWYLLKFEEFQQIDVPNSGVKKEMRLPDKTFVVRMAGLQDLDGIGNYLNVYGNMLIIEQFQTTGDGLAKLVLRREDGRDFFGLFPTIAASIQPLNRSKDPIPATQNYSIREANYLVNRPLN